MGQRWFTSFRNDKPAACSGAGTFALNCFLHISELRADLDHICVVQHSALKLKPNIADCAEWQWGLNTPVALWLSNLQLLNAACLAASAGTEIQAITED